MGKDLMQGYDILAELEHAAVTNSVEFPKVSIIVHTNNNDKYLERCLLSLLKQTMKETEIIVMANSLTNRATATLNRFRIDSRIIVINQEQEKLGAEFSKGIEIAKGEYVGFINSADFVDSDYYEKLYSSAKKYDADISLATNIKTSVNKKTKTILNNDSEKFVSDLQDKFDILKQEKNPCLANKLYRRKFLNDNNIAISENFCYDDKFFNVQVIYYANGIATAPNINNCYFAKTQLSHKRMCENSRKANLAILNFLKSKRVNLRDGDFWATKNQKKVCGITLCKTKESLKTEQTFLFGVIPLKKRNSKINLIQERYEQILKRISQKEKINVVFLNCSSPARWTYQSLYEEMEKSPIFNPMVLVYADKNLFKRKYKFLGYKKQILGAYDYFKKLNMNVELVYDIEKSQHKDLRLFEPDIIFYDIPNTQPKEYEVINTSEYALCMYNSYGSATSNGSNEYSAPLFKQVYRYYIDNPIQKKFLSGHGIVETALVVAGQLKLDAYLKPINESNIFWKSKEKKRIIIAPHFSFYKNSVLGFGTFDWNYKFFYEYAKNHPEYEFILKPHPNLKKQIVRKKLMTEEEMNEYFKQWQQLPNAQVIDGGSYFDMFRTSDCLITDCNSFLYEYLPTLKPVIHLVSKNSVGFNEFGKKIIAGYYHVRNISELEKTIDDVIVRNNDILQETRSKIVKTELFNPEEGCAKFILNNIIETLRGTK